MHTTACLKNTFHIELINVISVYYEVVGVIQLKLNEL